MNMKEAEEVAGLVPGALRSIPHPPTGTVTQGAPMSSYTSTQAAASLPHL
jgi:hypothetical protein